ncbi:MAG: hypothetical protein Q4G65_12900 [bacterium]|nr:hypothetical protein [bacterium]
MEIDGDDGVSVRPKRTSFVRSTCRNILLVLAFCAFGSQAAEIAFTNAAGGNDLSVAANWTDGALPSADDVGIVDVGTFGASYTVGTDVGIGGLKFIQTATRVTISGVGPLTLGAGGLTLDAAGGLALEARLATSADQTWSFGGGEVNCYSTISGTTALTLKSASFIHFRHPPNYGGKIICSAPVKYYENGTFCDTYSGSAKVYFMMTGNVEIAFSTLFPGKSYWNSAWDPNTDWVKQDTVPRSQGYPCLHMDEGTLKAGGCGFSMNGGHVRQTGGLMDCTEGWGIMVGDRTAYSPTGFGWGGAEVAYYMNGGEIKGRQVFLGMYYNVSSAPAYFEQTGGSVTVSRLAVGAGNQSAASTFSHYLMGGGTLDVGNNTTWFGSDPALVVSAYGGQASTASSVFTQTNGLVKAARIRWGSDRDVLGSAAKSDMGLGYRYALFELKGGRFELGSGGITNSASWHRNATNATYAMKMSGGTLAPQTMQVGRYQWQVVPSDGAFTVETEKQYTQVAPVWGRGTLRKTGSDTLALTDATQFKGKLAIDEGTVSFVGRVPTSTDDDGAIVWSADDIAEKNELADGDGVENLVSTDGQHTFVKADVPEASTISFADKVAISTDNVFAGHKSMFLHFNFLKMDAADNPLNGATNFTVVLVYRSSNAQWCCGETSVLWPYAAAMLGNVDDSVFTITHTRSDNISSTPRFAFGAYMNGGRQMMSQMDYDMNDNRAHVAIVSYSNNFVRVITDGYTTNHLVATATQLSHWRRLYNKPLYLGGVKNTKYTHTNQITHDTRLAELRIYPTRAMSERDCYRLGATLARKYGINEHGFVRFCAKGGDMVPAAVPVTPVATSYTWDADDLVAEHEDGEEITSWKTSDGETETATKTGTGSYHVQHGPSLCKNALNGHATVKFSRARKTALGVPASQNPIAGKKDFTLAVVFRTSDTDLKGDGTYGASVRDVSGDGIFGMRTYNYNAHDFGVTLHRFGTLMAAWSGGGNHYSYTTRPLFVNDGQPHIAVLSRDGNTGDYVWMVDGARMANGNTAGTTIAANYPLLFGVICHEQDYGYFEGEIAAARLYDRALSVTEMRAVSEYYAEKYGMMCLKQLSQGFADVQAVGLGATNVTVAAGATLQLPLSAEKPFVLKAGQMLAGEGTVQGSVRYAPDSVLDVAAERPAIEDLQIDGATLVFTRGQAADAPADGSNVSILTGTVTLDLTDWAAADPLPQHIKLMTLDPAAVDATFVLKGLSGNSQIVFHEDTGLLEVCTRRGCVIVFR